MPEIPIFDARREYEALAPELLAAAERVLASGAYILGPDVAAFEAEVAAYLGIGHAIGVASGTDALLVALKALGVGPGDRVIVPAFTFFATAGTVVNVGAEPVFVDVDDETLNLDPLAVQEVLEGRSPVVAHRFDPASVKAVIPVHLFGQPADMDELCDLATRHGLVVIEDNAQALGATYKGHQAGTIGDVGCLSFFPTKNLGAFGDAGMIVTGDDAVSERVRMLRAHGSRHKYAHEVVGTNSRLDTLQAALLRVRLGHFSGSVEARRRHAEAYRVALQKLDAVRLPAARGDRDHTYHQFTIRLEQRDAVQASLRDAGIGTAVHYPRPLHVQPAFAELGYAMGDLPVSEAASQAVLSLPMFPTLRDDEIDRVADALSAAVSRD